MNPKKAKLLETLEESARVHSASLLRSLDIAAHPEKHGWQRSILTAVVVLPLTGLSAIITEANRFLVAQSDDEAWDRSSPPPSDARDGSNVLPPDSSA
jgi:hypothetical protein